MKKILCLILSVTLLLTLFSGCNKSGTDDITNDDGSGSGTENSSTDSDKQEIDLSEIDSGDMFTNRDDRTEYSESDSITIKLSGNSAKTSDSSVKISGSTVTVTKESTYIVSGTLNDGMIIVDAPDTAKIQIVLKEVDITSSTSAPVYIKEADKVFITLEGENTLTNGGSFEAIDSNNIDAVVFSKQDVTFNGSGTLNVNSPAGHGIVSKDDLVFTGGTYNIASSAHAVDANDSVRIKNTTITTDAGKDGIHSENSDDSTKGYVYIESGVLNIECEGDGISAGSYMQIGGGTINIVAGGGYENGEKSSSSDWGNFGGGFGGPGGHRGERAVAPTSYSTTTESEDSSTSMKGLKADNNMLISGGTITIDSADDSIHSNISVTINGGTFELASGDDAIHAEETLSITKGTINITNSYEGLEALNIKLSGGNIKLKASDDGLNAAGGTDNSGMGGRDNMFGGKPNDMGGMNGSSNGSIVISGGTLYINASGDGIDANGTLEISGGHITVVGPTQGDTATLDYDKTAIITGGTFIGTGASNMAQTFSSSGQGVVAVSVSAQSANTKITLADKKGNVLISYVPELSYQVVILSSPEMKSGETYSLTVGSMVNDVVAG